MAFDFMNFCLKNVDFAFDLQFHDLKSLLFFNAHAKF